MGALDRRLVRRAREARVVLVCDAALGLIAALLVLAQAVLLARVAARSFGGASLAQLVRPLELLAVVVAARAAATWGFGVVGRRAAGRVLSRLRLELVERRLGAQPSALDGADSSELATVAVNGVDGLESIFTRYLPQMVLATVVPVAVLAVVASIDLVSAGVMLLTLPLVPVFMWLVGRYTERRTRERWQALSLLSSHFADIVRGLPTLRAFNRSRAQAEQIAAVGERYRRATMATLRVAFLSGAILELAATIGVALVAVTVGVRLVDGGLGFEAGLTVLVLAPELYAPIRNLAAQFHASADGAAVAGRLLDLIDAAPDVAGGTAAAPDLGTVPIRLDRVSLSYPGRPAAALERVDLELFPGETVALVGPSGAGKSTVASLLLRLVEPSRGRVVAGTVDAAGCSPEAWRRQLAWVPQRPTLLRGTVADNIRLADPDAAGEQVVEAALLAGADSFVRALPDGYETVVGEGGRPLSPGQVQRIALSRAFLRDAALVVLDEPTANLDRDSIEIVEEAIERLRIGRTVLLIAHRPELAAKADRVVRIDGGRISPPLVEAAA
jgi:thiol reductant ABC exporter CydD subunit